MSPYKLVCKERKKEEHKKKTLREITLWVDSEETYGIDSYGVTWIKVGDFWEQVDSSNRKVHESCVKLRKLEGA